jgi:aspartate 1-decarboxylase
MLRQMMKSKIHRATLTALRPDYEGSIAIDEDLLDAADILPGEQVHVLNLNNASRIVTYAIRAPRGSGTVELNGPAARCGLPGDIVVVIAYGTYADEEARALSPRIVLVTPKNRLRSLSRRRK